MKIVAICLFISVLIGTLVFAVIGKNITDTNDESNTTFLYTKLVDYNIIDGCYTNEKTITIPSNIDGNPITVIGIDSFKDSQCEEIIIEEGIKFIYFEAFANCTSLKKIQLPSTLEAISDKAFIGCSSLKEIIIPDNVKTIGISAFENCTNLSKITFPKNLSVVSDSVCRNTAIESVKLPDKVTAVYGKAFLDCKNLKDVYLPESVTLVSYDSFPTTVNSITAENAEVQKILKTSGFPVD